MHGKTEESLDWAWEGVEGRGWFREVLGSTLVWAGFWQAGGRPGGCSGLRIQPKPYRLQGEDLVSKRGKEISLATRDRQWGSGEYQGLYLHSGADCLVYTGMDPF